MNMILVLPGDGGGSSKNMTAAMTYCDLSFVVPCHNEQDNLRALVDAIHEAARPLGKSYEIIVTDDHSPDDSWAVLKAMAMVDARLRVQRFAANYGQSAALWVGIKLARGKIIVTLDADLQNDPAELPLFLQALEHFDCACGTRVKSRMQGDSRFKILTSRIANGVRNRLSGDNITDAGCCYRVFKRDCAARLKFFKGMHRFLPTLFKMEGFTVTEVPVNHRARRRGHSHYGMWNRVFASFYDLLAVCWMKKRMFRYQIAERLESTPGKAPTAGTQPPDSGSNSDSIDASDPNLVCIEG